ncbi:zinc finger protein 395a [Cyprinodon tularosa]|uniref:zinc finger protein 395a n=1 Tax=Cyprinodon tularosa TaxID=77115 RepID=UPI0018E25A4D|nr:zinc finger protein 395a [Cyprinodon tularosa]
MMPNTRLGKRSPLGALVGPPCPEANRTSIAMATVAGQQGIGRVRGHNDLKVYFQCGGAGYCQTDAADRSASSVSPSFVRSISSCIDVPRSRTAQQEVDMDELMAAMVLSSLSCSPPPPSQVPVHKETPAPSMDLAAMDISDSCSSGYWSVDRGPRSPAPSSPTIEANGRLATPTDEGLDMELDQVLFEEPAPRKRRNSLKVAYRCLWPSCAKVLTSLVGIKRHIRTVHLSHGGEHERCSRSEEDFYYSEINQRDESPPAAPPCGPAPFSPSTSPPSPPPPSPPSPPNPNCSTLSQSAPSPCSSSWQVQSEHSYQAPPPSLMVLPAAPTSCPLTAPPTTCSRQAFRVRSVSVGEQWLQHHSAPCRRIRSEAKKCRKVYGIEHRELWCTACRWKKACQRFQD